MKKNIAVALVAVMLVAAFAVPVVASDEDPDVGLSSKPAPLDAQYEDSLNALFDVLDGKGAFDKTRVDPLLDFVTGCDFDPKDIRPADRFTGEGICLRREVNSDLETILRYFYNPDIPNYLLCPSVLRVSGWRTGSEFLTRETRLWDDLSDLSEPVLVRGREFEVNTPDAFAETYYRYDLDRLLILLEHKGKKVMVSISKQDGKSDVGRKGAILNDQEWDYFYSDIPGMNKGFLSWMDTFMYHSASVQFFVENDGPGRKSSIFLMKWLNAGWSDMNVVKRSHIYDGSVRYATGFTKVLQSTALTPQEMAENMSKVASLTDTEVDVMIKEYARNFETRFKDNKKMQKRSYARVIKKGGYAEVLDADARRSVLALQKLKSLLGMETLLDMSVPSVAEVDEQVQPES